MASREEQDGCQQVSSEAEGSYQSFAEGVRGELCTECVSQASGTDLEGISYLTERLCTAARFGALSLQGLARL
jgi:hypothetical protein